MNNSNGSYFFDSGVPMIRLVSSIGAVSTLEPIVRFMSQCKRIFDDFTFSSCPIKLKLTSTFGRFWTNSGAQFHTNPTTGKEFAYRPPLQNLPDLGNVITLPKAGNFYKGSLWGNSSSVVESS